MVGSFLGLRMAAADVEMEAAMALAAAALATADGDDEDDDEEELSVAVAVADFPALVPTSLSLSSSMAKDRELAIFFRFSARSFFRRDEASSSRSRCLFSPSVMTSLTSSRALRKSSAVTNPGSE